MTATQLEVVAADRRMVLIERDAPVQSAVLHPRFDFGAPGGLDGERGDHPPERAQTTVGLADIVQ